jgi:hypothetical protein
VCGVHLVGFLALFVVSCSVLNDTVTLLSAGLVRVWTTANRSGWCVGCTWLVFSRSSA